MNTLSVLSLEPDSRFTDVVMLDKNFLVCAAGLPFTKDLIAALQEWNFAEVYYEEQLKSSVNPDGNLEGQPGTLQEDIPVTILTSERLKKALEQADILKNPHSTEDECIAVAEAIYDHYLAYIGAVYTRYATHKELRVKDISKITQSLCDFIAVSKRYILRIQPRALPEHKNHLADHSLRSTVLAIMMGMKLAFPPQKLVELGVSCILHEIGMIRLPPHLYLTNRKLTLPEKKLLFTHPLLGYNILKDYEFPLTTAFGVLDHHEKEDGSGYPRRIAGAKISAFGKIISVACAYDAITSPRTYKTEQTAHAAMLELVKNMGKQYDETAARALLFSISFFPIGSYVYLADGRLARVIDVNPGDPQNPVVRLVNEKNPDGTPKILDGGGTAYKISRALTLEETAGIKQAERQVLTSRGSL
ncbi:MAG: HD-GYP domain-containing protein [Treponemataceae bacterium]|nr:MAG: HD-GYP domain-containing protein [Treponemataceae bacterium]